MQKTSKHFFFSNLSIRVILLLLLMQPFSCRKDDKSLKLPPITTEGKNTFGAYVDGELWLPSDGAEFGIRPLCVSYGTDNSFSLGVNHDMAGTEESAGGAFGIVYKGINNIGSYDLTDINKAKVHVTIDKIDSPIASFIVLSGTLNIIRFDRANNVISGTFNFTIKNNDTHGIHTVTDGRFDVNFDYCK